VGRCVLLAKEGGLVHFLKEQTGGGVANFSFWPSAGVGSSTEALLIGELTVHEDLSVVVREDAVAAVL
jgi:hypothetical protein